MKAYKCPECGYLNVIYPPYGASFKECPECDFDFTLYHIREEVELIDWEYELITNNKPNG